MQSSDLALGFTGGPDGKESAQNVVHLGLIPGLGRSPGGGHGNPFQYSYIDNSHGQRSLVGYSPWGCKESDVTEQLSAQHTSCTTYANKFQEWKQDNVVQWEESEQEPEKL